MKKIRTLFLTLTLIVSLPSLACGVLNTSRPEDSLRPSNTPKPTQNPTTSNEQPKEFYAGFTQNPDIPFILFHQSGESLAAVGGVDPSTLKGVIWTSSNGSSSIVVYADSNGIPQSAVVGDDVVFYSNFTDDTVDLTIVHPDGSQETVQATRNTDVLNKLEALTLLSLQLISYSPGAPELLDAIDLIKIIAKIAGAAFCIHAIAGTGGLTLPILAGPCLGTVLTVITEVGKALGLHVEIIEEFNYQSSILKCPLFIWRASQGDLELVQQVGDLPACISAAATALQQIRDFASTKLENANSFGGLVQPDTSSFGKTATPPATDIPIFENPTLSLNQRSNCREGPSTAYEVVYSFEAGKQFEIIGTYGSGWWLVPIELDFTRKKSCWIYEEGNTINGDVNNVPQVQPSPLPPTEAPPASGDLLIYDFYSQTVVDQMSCSEASMYVWEKDVWSETGESVYFSSSLYGDAAYGVYERDAQQICGW